MRLAIAFPLRLSLCALLCAPLAPHAEADKRDFSAAERLLFMTPQLQGLQAPMLLRYTFGKTGSLEESFADNVTVALIVVPLKSEKGLRLDYQMAMGVRYGEREWKQQVEGLIESKAPEIQAILKEFGVPLVDASFGAPTN